MGKRAPGMVLGTPLISVIFLSSKLDAEAEELIKIHELCHTMRHHIGMAWCLASILLGNFTFLFSSSIFILVHNALTTLQPLNFFWP